MFKLYSSNTPNAQPSTHPVQGVGVECVAGVLPVRFTCGLEADLTDGKDITLLLLFTVGYLESSAGVSAT